MPLVTAVAWNRRQQGRWMLSQPLLHTRLTGLRELQLLLRQSRLLQKPVLHPKLPACRPEEVSVPPPLLRLPFWLARRHTKGRAARSQVLLWQHSSSRSNRHQARSVRQLAAALIHLHCLGRHRPQAVRAVQVAGQYKQPSSSSNSSSTIAVLPAMRVRVQSAAVQYQAVHQLLQVHLLVA